MDETAFTWGIGPTHMFVPRSQKRGIGICSKTKVRATVCVTVNGEGSFAPNFIIIKHSKSSLINPDQTSMTVINLLHKKDGFQKRDGWKLQVWSKELDMKVKNGNSFKAVHKCKYLIHTDGTVITSQRKLWNDSTRMAMYIDLILQPILERDMKILLWMDNCKLHKAQCIDDSFNDNGIDVAWLPENTTDILQVLDVVVNGPIKRHTRSSRAMAIKKDFQVFKVVYAEENKKPIEERKRLKFKPNPPSLIQGIKNLRNLFNNEFKQQEFVDSIKAAFIDTCTMPDNRGTFKIFSANTVKSAGLMLFAPKNTQVNEEIPEIPDQFPDITAIFLDEEPDTPDGSDAGDDIEHDNDQDLGDDWEGHEAEDNADDGKIPVVPAHEPRVVTHVATGSKMIV